VPPAIGQSLGEAAVTGFHDTILLLTVVAAAGLPLALLVRDFHVSPVKQPAPAVRTTPQLD
jgi:hypothetical protein